MEIRWTDRVKNEEVLQNTEWMNEWAVINLSMQASLQRTVVNIFNGFVN